VFSTHEPTQNTALLAAQPKMANAIFGFGLSHAQKRKPNLQNQTKEKLLTQFVLLLPARHPEMKSEIVI